MSIQTVNPATEEVLHTYPLFTKQAIEDKIEAAHAAYLGWREVSFAERTKKMQGLAALLRKKQNELAVLMAKEMGKPISLGIMEIQKSAWVCEHFAEHAQAYLAPRNIETEMKKSMVVHRPLGVVFAIMPWNFPFWQVFRFAAPTIMAGNAAILKHAPSSTGSGNAIAELFQEAQFPTSLFQHFILDNDLAASVIAHPSIAGVSLTGSERAGKEVAAIAAQHLKKSVLELGGNDPYVILADADLRLAANCIVTSRLSNSGQVCIAAKRIIVVQSCLDELIQHIIAEIPRFAMGDPLDAAISMGPLARKDLRNMLHQQVAGSIKAGAKLLMGGEIPNQPGFYYPPTLLADVKPGMPAFDEELFGPVIAVTAAQDEEEAIRLANTSQYGLGGAVFTSDVARGEYIAVHRMEVGACFVNAFVSSDPRVPFGGIKRSGFGRELSREGILEFVNIKSVSIG